MKYRIRKNIYLAYYLGYLAFLLVNAVFYGQYAIFDTLYLTLFPILLFTILISFVSFLSTMFSSEKYESAQFKFLLIMHGGYFLLAMIIYRIFFY